MYRRSKGHRAKAGRDADAFRSAAAGTGPRRPTAGHGQTRGRRRKRRLALLLGVCGTAWKENRTLLVPDVEAFPGHIACSAASRSEIVVPVHNGNQVVAVLDIDSQHLATFDAFDRHYLEAFVRLLP